MILEYGTGNRRPRVSQSEHSLDIVAHQFLRTHFNPRNPLEIDKRTFPVCGSRITESMPKNGTVAEPGFVSIAPGNGVMTMLPVSVCQ